MAIGLINETEPEEWYEWLYAIQNYKYDVDIQRTGWASKIIETMASTNVFAKRLFTRHIPMIFENKKRNLLTGTFNAVFNELSFYPTSKVNLPFDLYDGAPLWQPFGDFWLDQTGTRRGKSKKSSHWRIKKHLKELERKNKKGMT